MFSVLLASFSDMLVPKFDDLRICQFREGNRDSSQGFLYRIYNYSIVACLVAGQHAAWLKWQV